MALPTGRANLPDSSAAYENGALSLATGEALRPGGQDLTGRLLQLCQLPAGASLLDVGCGTGSTVQYMRDQAALLAFGLDRSELLLQTALSLRPQLPLTCGWAKSLPFASDSLHAILAECSLSTFSELDAVLAEFWRVLRPAGRLALSDIYARNSDGLPALRALPLRCGLRDAQTQPELLARLRSHGFEMITWEDHSETLKYLATQLTLAHGSTSGFWNRAEPDVDAMDLQIAISKAKLGYYLLVAEKG